MPFDMVTQSGNAEGQTLNKPVRRWGLGLSSQLFALTIIFILVAEMLIFLPSAAKFRDDWINERVGMAQTAVMALEAAPERRVSDQLSRDLLERARIVAVATGSPTAREAILTPAMEMRGEFKIIDVRTESFLQRFAETMGTLITPEASYYRIVAEPEFEGDFIEVVVEAAPLQTELREYSRSIILLSFFISAFVGFFIYLTLVFLVVRPMRNITRAIEHIRDAPRDMQHSIEATERTDEIGRTQSALADMETTVKNALRERERLAQLGEAMAKINHDLRNSLAAAQIVSDGLSMSDDPRVQRAAPRLERAIERASKLAEDTLAFGRAETPAPHLGIHALAEIVREAASEGLAVCPGTGFEQDVDGRLTASIDPDHLHRIIVNLVRNAAQALSAHYETAGEGRVSVRATVTDNSINLNIVDNGPGIPERMRESLFKPFSGTRREGRSGLGLAIARELADGMNARLDLISTGPDGTTFELVLKR